MGRAGRRPLHSSLLTACSAQIIIPKIVANDPIPTVIPNLPFYFFLYTFVFWTTCVKWYSSFSSAWRLFIICSQVIRLPDDKGIFLPIFILYSQYVGRKMMTCAEEWIFRVQCMFEFSNYSQNEGDWLKWMSVCPIKSTCWPRNL